MKEWRAKGVEGDPRSDKFKACKFVRQVVLDVAREGTNRRWGVSRRFGALFKTKTHTHTHTHTN